MLAELDQLERKWLEDFRQRLKTADPELAIQWFADAVKRVALTKLKVEDRYRSIERAVSKGI